LAHFRIRIAQSHVRSDLLPSFWSLAGILEDDEFFASAPFDGQADASEVPRTNGVRSCRLDEYDDPMRFPNIAVLQFTDDVQPIFQNIDRVKSQRNVVDLPTLMLSWLGYIMAFNLRHPMILHILIAMIAGQLQRHQQQMLHICLRKIASSKLTSAVVACGSLTPNAAGLRCSLTRSVASASRR
jgi:hypothetical protein